ncbi:MAG: hypothetical protein Q9227_002095 [Pyrenula ochraceoflavens]
MSGEFCGTVLFLFFSFAGTQVAGMTTQPASLETPQRLIYIALSFGLSLLVNAWAFYRISGGLFNPAVTLGLCIAKAVPWARGLYLLPSQLIGAIVASALASCMFPGNGPNYTITRLAAGTSIARGLFIEAICTAQLIFVILMLAAEKSKDTFLAPLGIGLALFLVELSGVYFTGGAVNPARAFGPSVVGHDFPGYHWIYWLGPLLGAGVASGYYRVAKALNYEEANPGQDAEDEEEAARAARSVGSRPSS